MKFEKWNIVFVIFGIRHLQEIYDLFECRLINSFHMEV